MKIIALLALTVFSALHANAAATLSCRAEDGTTIQAVESADDGRLHNIKLSVRGSSFVDYPAAYVARIETNGSTVTNLVVIDPTEGILVTVIGNVLYDVTGSYEVESCELSM